MFMNYNVVMKKRRLEKTSNQLSLIFQFEIGQKVYNKLSIKFKFIVKGNMMT